MGTAGSVGPRGLGETWPAAGGGTRPKGHRRPSAARVSLPCILSSLGAPALRAKAVSRLALHALRAIDAPGRAGCAGIADGAAGGSRSSGDGSVRWAAARLLQQASTGAGGGSHTPPEGASSGWRRSTVCSHKLSQTTPACSKATDTPSISLPPSLVPQPSLTSSGW